MEKTDRYYRARAREIVTEIAPWPKAESPEVMFFVLIFLVKRFLTGGDKSTVAGAFFMLSGFIARLCNELEAWAISKGEKQTH